MYLCHFELCVGSGNVDSAIYREQVIVSFDFSRPVPSAVYMPVGGSSNLSTKMNPRQVSVFF